MPPIIMAISNFLRSSLDFTRVGIRKKPRRILIFFIAVSKTLSGLMNNPKIKPVESEMNKSQPVCFQYFGISLFQNKLKYRMGSMMPSTEINEMGPIRVAHVASIIDFVATINSNALKGLLILTTTITNNIKTER